MIKLNDYPIFQRHFSNLRETSKDGPKDNPVYMTQSTREAVAFDEVKKEYVSGLGLSDNPKSNDALFDDGRGCLVFVEFKNGFMNKAEQFSVRKKNYDSVLMFADITSTRISETRKNMKYILVYNKEKNYTNPDKESEKKTTVQESASFDDLAKMVIGYADDEYIHFGLRMFKNYCFKEVHTYTEEEFKEYLSTL